MQIGDVLYLNSGGPPVTCMSISAPDPATNIVSVGIAWFSGAVIGTGTYPQQSLTATDPTPAIAAAQAAAAATVAAAGSTTTTAGAV